MGIAMEEGVVERHARGLNCRIAKVPFTYLRITVGPHRSSTWLPVVKSFIVDGIIFSPSFLLIFL